MARHKWVIPALDVHFGSYWVVLGVLPALSLSQPAGLSELDPAIVAENSGDEGFHLFGKCRVGLGVFLNGSKQ